MKKIKKLKLGLLTSSRADYGIYHSLLKEISKDKSIVLEKIIFGPHLLEAMSQDLKIILGDGFGKNVIVGDFSKTDSSNELAIQYSQILKHFVNFWSYNKYDTVLSLGDRFEMSAAIQASIPYQQHITHIHGGEKTIGSIDEIYRHQITIASKLHFTSIELYKKRVERILGIKKNVFSIGSLSLTNLESMKIKSWEEVINDLRIPNKPFILITVHPESYLGKITDLDIEELYKALSVLKDNYLLLITGTNSDKNYLSLNKMFTRFNKKFGEETYLVESLGKENYFSALKNCSFLLGNSSSGIIEAASFNKFAINLGKRQEGRIMNQNVINTDFKYSKIIEAVNIINKSNSFYDGGNIYYKRDSDKKILNHLKKTFIKL